MRKETTLARVRSFQQELQNDPNENPVDAEGVEPASGFKPPNENHPVEVPEANPEPKTGHGVD